MWTQKIYCKLYTYRMLQIKERKYAPQRICLCSGEFSHTVEISEVGFHIPGIDLGILVHTNNKSDS